ncbi:pilus assembly protein TadG-related protein [Pseudomonas sp. 7P_10.2_Bac1]|uniref:pilus assembly protein TadG-related protein n=1 Tax=Pseudomonas sp. 7P_10.2_Bac1 TaxID=2971614 RepID=UPI0021CA7CDC|nr:pilus assembly protein TadG-related protein [Pseudomonas sp. 7P_10.2_Bac1]MCU1728406.1 pilus assembly protein TadG-related protein [Pseudomonas sp. 7P_10.2_Bac1]
MSPPFRRAYFNGPRQQHGAIGLIAALTLGMVLIFMLLVVDGGRLYLEQRKLQRVADMAVLEAVSRGGSCAATPSTATLYATQSAARNSFVPAGTQQTLNATCGTLVTVNQLRTFQLDPSKSDAIRVIATNTIPTSIAGGVWDLVSKGTLSTTTKLTASAVGAFGGSPLAMLTIRSSLANVDSTSSPLLNSLIGGMLGGSLNLSAVSWQGLATTNINLLSYLDQLAITAGVSAGNYNQLLNSDIKLTQFLDAAITVLEKNGGGVTVASKALGNIKLIASNTQVLKLGDLLNIQNGTPAAGLNTNIKVFDLLEGIVQLSNGKSAATATINTNIPLIGAATIYLKVIEPPQVSIIGNPALAKANPTGPNKIYVKTAQIQTRIHLDLAIVRLLNPLVDALTSVLSTVLEVVKHLLNLNLIEVIKCTLSCQSAPLSIASALDIYVEAGSASGYVTDYSCASDGPKSLTVLASASLAKLSIGSAPQTGAFPPVDSNNNLIIDPVKLINMDVKTCYVLGLLCTTDEGKAGSFNVKVQSSVSQPPKNIYYTSTIQSPTTLPNINQTPYYQQYTTQNIVDSLGNSLLGNITTSYTPPPGKTVTGDLLNSISSLVNQLTSALATAFSKLLSPLLDPLINTLLKALGVSLGNAEIGANLSCNQGGRPQLVL